MAAPPKPWESVGVNRRSAGNGFCGQNLSGDHIANGNCGGQPHFQSSYGGTSVSQAIRNQNMSPRVPPPIPPRPDQQTNASVGYNRYGLNYNSYSPYSTFSSHMYSPMYSSYGGYGLGSRFGYGQDYYGSNGVENSFVRVAEESSRPAFQSIESIVHAVGSVSMMLESTYHALYSSFRAVIGVADHFSRLKDHLAHILSTLALVRTLHWLCQKVLFMLGVSKTNPSVEAAWSAATTEASGATILCSDLQRPRSSWPIFMFLSVVFGAPWLIWRLLSKVTANQETEAKLWASGQDEHYVGLAQYDFQGEAPRELSFHSGQQIILAPKNLQPKVRGWLLGSIDGQKVGLIPGNYIKIIGYKQGFKNMSQDGASTSASHIVSPQSSSQQGCRSENFAGGDTFGDSTHLLIDTSSTDDKNDSVTNV